MLPEPGDAVDFFFLTRLGWRSYAELLELFADLLLLEEDED